MFLGDVLLFVYVFFIKNYYCSYALYLVLCGVLLVLLYIYIYVIIIILVIFKCYFSELIALTKNIKKRKEKKRSIIQTNRIS